MLCPRQVPCGVSAVPAMATGVVEKASWVVVAVDRLRPGSGPVVSVTLYFAPAAGESGMLKPLVAALRSCCPFCSTTMESLSAGTVLLGA